MKHLAHWIAALALGMVPAAASAHIIAGELTPDRRPDFPVTQDCEKDGARWTEIPAAGQDRHALKFPAPGVMLVAQKAADTQAHGQARDPAIKVGALTIEAPWSRATPAGAKTAAGYLKITNNGKEPDRLLRGTFAAAARSEVHEMAMVNDVMKMRELADGLEIKPGETVELKPGGYHMMFMDLKTPLKAGQTVKGTLVFQKAGSVAVSYTIAPLGATSGGDHKH